MAFHDISLFKENIIVARLVLNLQSLLDTLGDHSPDKENIFEGIVAFSLF